VHKVGNNTECNNMHGERIKIILVDLRIVLNLSLLLYIVISDMLRLV